MLSNMHKCENPFFFFCFRYDAETYTWVIFLLKFIIKFPVKFIVSVKNPQEAALLQ